MQKIMIHKPKAVAPYLMVNTKSVGVAAGILKQCGLRVYLYLCCNSDGYQWTLNTIAFKAWLGISDDATARRIIRDGLKDLEENKFLVKTEEGASYDFDFYEVQRPD